MGAAAGATWIGSLFGALGIGSALSVLGIAGLIALAAVGLVVGGTFVLNALTNKVFGQGIGEIWSKYINSLFERSETGGWQATNLPGGGGNYDAGISWGQFLVPQPGEGNPQRAGTGDGK